MAAAERSPITATEWSDACRRAKIVGRASVVAGVLLVGRVALPAAYLAEWTALGNARPFAVVTWMSILIMPITAELARRNSQAQRASDAIVELQSLQLTEAVRLADEEAACRAGHRQRFETSLANALDMADGKPEVIDVIERSFAANIPPRPSSCSRTTVMHTSFEVPPRHRLGYHLVAVSTHQITVPPRAARKFSAVVTAKIWTRAQNFEIAKKVPSPRCACRSRSWDTRWVSFMRLHNKVTYSPTRMCAISRPWRSSPELESVSYE